MQRERHIKNTTNIVKKTLRTHIFCSAGIDTKYLHLFHLYDKSCQLDDKKTIKLRRKNDQAMFFSLYFNKSFLTMFK